MRAVVTRVSRASVSAGGEKISEIGKGLLVLLGVGKEDSEADAVKMADRVCGLRIFDDDSGKMNVNLLGAGGQLMVVSQFTLYADTKSRRPGFTGAAGYGEAEELYGLFAEECRKRGFDVRTGRFGADMQVESVNDGPVTILLDSARPGK